MKKKQNRNGRRKARRRRRRREVKEENKKNKEVPETNGEKSEIGRGVKKKKRKIKEGRYHVLY